MSALYGKCKRCGETTSLTVKGNIQPGHWNNRKQKTCHYDGKPKK